MPVNYPADLPYESMRDAFKIPKLGQDLMKSPMQSGKVRMRPQFTLRITEVETAIYYSPAELERFLDFVNNTLGQGSAEFNMRVWILQKYAYESRLVQIVDGVAGISLEPFADDQAMARFKLAVRNL